MANRCNNRLMIIGTASYFAKTQLLEGMKRALESSKVLSDGEVQVVKDYTFDGDDLRVVQLEFDTNDVPPTNSFAFNEFIPVHSEAIFLLDYGEPRLGFRGAMSVKDGHVYEAVSRRCEPDGAERLMPDLFTEHLPAGISF